MENSSQIDIDTMVTQLNDDQLRVLMRSKLQLRTRLVVLQKLYAFL